MHLTDIEAERSLVNKLSVFLYNSVLLSLLGMNSESADRQYPTFHSDLGGEFGLARRHWISN